MAIYDYNDIRNDDWYNRLVRGVRERTSASVRRAGADPSDPYWRAKEAEQLGDLSNARRDAFRRAFAVARERQALAGARMREQEAARQRTISAALARDWRPDVGLGTMSEGTTEPAGLGAAAPEPIQTYTAPAPEAYPRLPAPTVYASERSAAPAGVYTNRAWAAGQAARGGYAPARAAGVYAGYNPTVFQPPAITRKRRDIDENYANLARRWF